MSLRFRALRVLLVDDHPLIRTAMRALLQRSVGSVVVTEAGCADDALAIAVADTPNLALLDVNPPGTSGVDLLRELRRHFPRLRIPMVAAEVDPWTVAEALSAGASGFLAKTNPGELLPGAAGEVLEGRTFLCPEATAARERSRQFCAGPHELPGPAVLSVRESKVLSYLERGDNTKNIAIRHTYNQFPLRARKSCYGATAVQL